MKILHIVAGAKRGGAETFCLDAIKSLNEQNITQHVICRPYEHVIQTLQSLNIPYTILTFSRFRKKAEKKTIASVIQDFAPDLVHCWMARASSFMPENQTVPALGWFGSYYKLKNYKNCDFYMGVTRDVVRYIAEETKKPERCFLVHTFGTLEHDAPVSRTDFNIPENGKTVLLLSRMHWKKGIDTLLHAAKKLDDTYFLLAGDGPEMKKYMKLSTKLALESRVRFLGWRNDRAALLKIADVCALPSRCEAFGTVIAESWYSGVPLVATRANGARQYVTHGVDGLLSDIDDSDTLAENLKTALNDAAVRKTLIENGQKTYQSLFSKDVVTNTLIQSYKDMIAAYRKF